jgi:hypothetical protein
MKIMQTNYLTRSIRTDIAGSQEIRMKTVIHYTAVSICLLILTACTSWYGYAGKRYDTKEEALKAQQNEIDAVIANIEPTNQPKYENALIIFPSREAIEKRGFSGNLDLTSDAVDYLATTAEELNKSMAEVLKKRNLFKKVEVRRALYPGVAADSRISILASERRKTH